MRTGPHPGGLLEVIRLQVPPLRCGSCTRVLERVLGALPGVRVVDVHFRAATVCVWHDSTVPTPQLQRAALDALWAAGHPAQRWDPGETP